MLRGAVYVKLPWVSPGIVPSRQGCKAEIGKEEVVEEYQPTSRRPIAEIFRRTAGWSVKLCVRLRIHPDTVSYASLVASALAAGCFLMSGRWPWLLLVGPLFCYLRLWMNMLDGMVAVATGKASRRGEILNDLPDRFSDVMIFAGVAQSGLCHPFLGYWTAIAAVLTAYVGMLAQAVGAPRQFGGCMSKPWRMVVLHLGAWTAWIFLMRRWPFEMRFGTPLDWACIAIILGCIQTIWVRLRRTMALL
jgi:phosphatidylglycerophosphate synthase